MSSLDNIKSKDDYMFAHQFHWFMGVIEDITDPEQRGRYRVRCFGYHTEKKDYIPTTTLPWAHVMMPVTGAAQCGVGESATGLLRGTWVIGFFRDGQTAQDPVIMGSIPAVTPTVDYKFGFCDPVEQYPYGDKAGKNHPDLPEEALSAGPITYKDSFSYKKKDEHRKLTPVAIAFAGDWELPPIDTIIRVEYPKNHVKAWERKVPLLPVIEPVSDTTGILDKDVEKVEFFEGGVGLIPKKEMHVQEFDVTLGWERISTMHNTGTYKEWTPVGDDTTVIVGHEFRIIVKNQHINVKGNCTLTVEGNLHTLVEGDEYRHIKGNLIEQIDGSKTTTVIGNVSKNHAMNEMKTVAANKTQAVGANKMDTTGQNEGGFVGMIKHGLSVLNDEAATFNDYVRNSAGTIQQDANDKINQWAKGAWSLVTDNDFVQNISKNFQTRVGENKEESIVKDSTTGIGGARSDISGGPSAVGSAGGPHEHTGCPVHTGGHLSVKVPPG